MNPRTAHLVLDNEGLESPVSQPIEEIQAPQPQPTTHPLHINRPKHGNPSQVQVTEQPPQPQPPRPPPPPAHIRNPPPHCAFARLRVGFLCRDGRAVERVGARVHVELVQRGRRPTEHGLVNEDVGMHARLGRSIRERKRGVGRARYGEFIDLMLGQPGHREGHFSILPRARWVVALGNEQDLIVVKQVWRKEGFKARIVHKWAVFMRMPCGYCMKPLSTQSAHQ